jgi:peptide/nickel transport system substrate-binding protein
MVGRADFDVIKSQFHSANRNALLNLDPATNELHDAELDALLAQIASVPTTEERQQASVAAQQHLADQAYVLPLFEEPQVFGLRSQVEGFKTESIGRPSFYEVTLQR